MDHIRREKKVFKTVNEIRVPIIAFRYSFDRMQDKLDIRFTRTMRAEIYVHLQGNCIIYMGDKIYNAKPGDIFIYNKDEVHFSVIAADTVHERFVLHFLPEYFDFIDDLPVNLLNFYYERKNYENNLISLPKEKYEQLLMLLQEADCYRGKNQFENDFTTFQYFIKILHYINEGYLSYSNGSPLITPPKLITEIIQYINRNFSRNCTLESIAQYANISKSYLSAVFKKYIGISPYEYLLNIRLDHAKKLLAYGENITDVCFAAGFNDYSHFIQFFKKRTGITPAQYQKKYLKNQKEL